MTITERAAQIIYGEHEAEFVIRAAIAEELRNLSECDGLYEQIAKARPGDLSGDATSDDIALWLEDRAEAIERGAD